LSIATLAGLSYSYPRASAPALRDVNLQLEDGAFALLAGPSGGGKSTLLRVFNGLVPQFHGGVLCGSARVAGLDPARTSPRQMATVAGMVFQEPEAQAVAETVIEELAFGLEQAAVPRPEMHRRVDRMLCELGIEHLRHRRLATLSGGERQRVALASVLVLGPRVLLLDEPTSQLDPAGAEALLSALRTVHSQGLTLLVAEHRLERLLPAVTSVVSVAKGRVQALAPREALNVLDGVPALARLFRAHGLPPPLTPAEAMASATASFRARARAHGSPGGLLLAVSGLTVAYGEHAALRDASLELREGELVALLGANGSGKSTLLRTISGLRRPVAGEVRFQAASAAPRDVAEITRIAGLVPQDPALALYRDTVADELHESLEHRMGRREARTAALSALERWGLTGIARRNPRDLSVGQQQRVAIGAMLAHQPRIWMLDEPTRGADWRAKQDLAGRLRAHAAAGGAAIVATHDVEGAAAWATRVITLDTGRMVSDLPAHQAFAAGGPHPTQIARVVPGAVALEDVEYVG